MIKIKTRKCQPATYQITDSGLDVLYSGTIASGGSLDQTIADSTATLKDTADNVISTTQILAEGSEDIVAPDATYTVEYLNGTPIQSGNIPSGGFQLIQVPNPITCADAVVNVNSVFFDNVASGGTLNIQVRKSSGSNLVGSKQGQHWRIADSTAVLKTSGGATISTTSIRAEESEDITAPDATVENSNATYTDTVVSGGTLVLPDVDVDVNGVNEGMIPSVQNIDIILTDGTNQVTPNDVTVVGNVVTIEQGEVWWKRNPNWLPLPTVNVGDNRFVGLYAVFEDDADGNTITIDIGVGKQIDYGDGTIITSITGTNTHVYNYATISSPILQMAGGTNYKMVVVDCDITGTLGLNLNQNITGRSQRVTGWLDIVAAGSSLTGVRVSDNLAQGNRGFAMFLERLLILEMNTSGTPIITEILNSLPKIKVLEYPILNVLTSFARLFSRSGDIRDSQGQPISINNTAFTGNLFLTFNNSGITELGDIILPNATAAGDTFFNSKIKEVGNIDLSSVNSLLFFFGSSQLQKVGTITVGTNLTSIDRAFQNVYNIRRLVFAGDMANVTNTNLTFQNAFGLQELIMPNLRVGFDIRATAITGTNLQDLFTSLGTASGVQTITLPSFTIGQPTAIATGKGYTIAYA